MVNVVRFARNVAKFKWDIFCMTFRHCDLFFNISKLCKSLRFAVKCNFLLVEFLLWKCLNMWLLPTTPFLLFVQQMLVKAVRTNEVVTPFALNLLLDKSFKFSFIILHTHNAMQCRLLLPLKMWLLQNLQKYLG